LGAWWSYEVLGWGGYWAWDPVENASFLPWLTATAYLHSALVQERRMMLRVWNLSLLIATFSLTILGTFLTRSGVLDSVHAFTESGIGPAILGFLACVVAVSLGLLAWAAVTVVVACVVAGWRGLAPLLAFGLGAFAAAAAVRQLAASARRLGWRGLVGRASGGMVVHLGVVIIAVAFAASHAYGHRH